MSFERIKEKLNILADAAKYCIYCSSSGSKRANKRVLGIVMPSVFDTAIQKMADAFLC